MQKNIGQVEKGRSFSLLENGHFPAFPSIDWETMIKTRPGGNFRQAFCVFNVAETVDSLGGAGVDIDGIVAWPRKKSGSGWVRVVEGDFDSSKTDQKACLPQRRLTVRPRKFTGFEKEAGSSSNHYFYGANC